VQVSAGFSAAVDIEFGAKTASARSILALLGLGATAGTTVVVRAVGTDAEAAVSAVVGVLETAE
jgi:phosphotransferase system HPr (HPr) family protein